MDEYMDVLCYTFWNNLNLCPHFSFISDDFKKLKSLVFFHYHAPN